MNIKNKIYLGVIVTSVIGFVWFANWSYHEFVASRFVYDWYRDQSRAVDLLSVIWILAAPVRLKRKIALLVIVPIVVHLVGTFYINNCI